jgi:hypothetical protein
MSDRGTADQDLFQIWLASSRDFFTADYSADPMNAAPMTESLKQKCEGLFASWNQIAQTYAKAGAKAGVTGGPFDPVGWLDAAGGGGFGDLWQWFGDPGAAETGPNPWREQRDALTASQEWLAYTAALERYRAVMGAAWLNAFKRFAEELARDSGPDTSDGLPGWEVIQVCWQQAAGIELAAAQRSDDFLAAQRDLIRARLDCSALLRGQVEEMAKMLGLPTRAEVDELHQTLHGLKREVRALKARIDGDK